MCLLLPDCLIALVFAGHIVETSHSCMAQVHLDKQDLRIELSVAALRKQAKKAVKAAANLEVTAGIFAVTTGRSAYQVAT